MPIRIRDLSLIVLALWILGGGLASSAAQKAAAPGLPDDAREALKKKWPDWQLATTSANLATCLPAGKPPAALVTADFDSDGHADYAAAIQTKQGVRLTVLTWRLWGFDLYDVDSLDSQNLDRLDDHAAAASIVIAPRGLKFANPRTLLDDYFPGDTLTTRTCDKSVTAYFWSGIGFNRMVIPSVAAQHFSARP